jgi:hypothetical protein
MKSLSMRRGALLVALPLLVLGWAPAALAYAPTGPYAQFGDCPLSQPNVIDCLVTQATGGQITIGNATVPITRTITLQGGIAQDPETEALSFVPAADGNTLSATPLEVPGGLPGLLPRSEGGAVTATLELVGPVQLNIFNLIFEEGPALVLPSSIRLSNHQLGARCHIGSSDSPILLELTDGTTSPPPPNKPISGSLGTIAVEQGGSIVTLTGGSLVDNAFAASGADDCGPSGALDRLLDSRLGLPSAAGHNTAIIDTTITLATASAVLESE